jgi:hypothetical protein
MAEILYRRHALAIAGGLALGLAAVVAHSAALNGRRGELEHWSQKTAVGDKQLYPVGAEAPALTYRGKPLVSMGPEPHEIRETRAMLVGEDDSRRFHLYLHRDNLPHDGSESADAVYLLKVGVNSFLRFQRADRKE